MCVEVYSVNVGENEHQDIVKHTDKSRRLIVYDIYHDPARHIRMFGSVLVLIVTCAFTGYTSRITNCLHVHFTVNVDGNGQGGMYAVRGCSRSFLWYMNRH